MNRLENYGRKAMWPVAFALAAFVVAGCGGGGSDAAAPAPTPTPVADPVGAVCTQGAACVPLATAGNYTILANSGVSTTGTTAITGHVGLNADEVGLTGFDQTLDASGTFSTSALVIGGGRLYASNYAAPTPAELLQAISDASTAFTDVDSPINHPVGVGNTDLGSPVGNITGMNLVPGVYEWTAAVVVVDAAGVTLTGGPTDVWIFRTPGDITMNSGAAVTLAGGALPQNVFWRSGGVVALDTTANLKGIVLAGSNITMANGATVNGRLIATSAATLIGNTVTRPAP